MEDGRRKRENGRGKLVLRPGPAQGVAEAMEDGDKRIRRQGDKETGRQGDSPLLPFFPSPLVSSGLLLLAALCLVFAGAAGALGNGVPVKVFLNYLPDISNWGPQTAGGEAVLAVGEGWATVSVQGLPKLQGEVYVAWVIPHRGAPIPLGKFNTDDAGTGDFEIRGLSVPHEPYKLFLLTVERDSDQYQAPGDRRSIAGRFPDPELGGALPTLTPAPTPSPGPGGSPGQGPGAGSPGTDTETASSLAQPVPTQPVPLVLPITGGPVRQVVPSIPWNVAGATGLALIGLAWFVTSRQACTGVPPELDEGLRRRRDRS